MENIVSLAIYRRTLLALTNEINIMPLIFVLIQFTLVVRGMEHKVYI